MLTPKVANLINQQGESSRCMVRKKSCKKKKSYLILFNFFVTTKKKRHTIKYSCKCSYTKSAHVYATHTPGSIVCHHIQHAMLDIPGA